MSNEIKIENTVRDNHMLDEIHHHERCKTKQRNGIYTDQTGGLERTLEVLVIFMVCRCGKKSRNPFPEFLQGHSIHIGESVDVHLPDKNCNYIRHLQYEDHKQTFRFECHCYCRNERVSRRR